MEEKYNALQLSTLLNSTISLLKFDEAESYDGTIESIKTDPKGEPYLSLAQHEEEKFLISEIEEIYLHIEGHLPVFYVPIDYYEEESFIYQPEYIEGFQDYLGLSLKLYGLFGDSYEITGTLNEVRTDELKLVINDKAVELWRINVIFQMEEDNKYYVSPEDLSETFDEPLDNLYSVEDFDMLVGRKIRIKTMNPEVADEVATVSGYSLAEGYVGEEVYHLELEEFPDLILEPGIIQFIYLIGDDGSETLVEPSGGGLYNPPEEDEVEDWHELLETRYFTEFKNDILASLRPQCEEEICQIMWLKFSKEDFLKIAVAIKQWYIMGTPASFKKQISNNVSVFDSRNLPNWFNYKRPVEAGKNERPFSNEPFILIQDKSIKDDQINFVFYSITDIDKLNDSFGLGLNNYSLAVARMYEKYAEDQYEPLDYFKASIKNIKEFLNFYPKHIIALNSLGSNLYLLGKIEDSLEYTNKALEINPLWLPALVNKVDACLELNDLDNALKITKQAQNLEPEEGMWEWYLAQIYDKMDNREEAQKHAREAVRKGYNEDN